MAPRRGVYLLPNLLTTAALFAGFYSIVISMSGHFQSAAIALFIAMVLDNMDGRIARMTNTQSDFGMHYDSLSDMVSFGLAPALVMYKFILFSMGKLGWLVAFFYMASAALRLARFNTQVASIDKRFFQGLPSPAAAAMIASVIWLLTEYNLQESISFGVICLLVTIAAGLLMVSNIRYHSFKQFDMKGRMPFISTLSIMAIFILIAIEPALILFTMTFIYVLSGLVLTLILLKKHKNARKIAESE